MSAPPDLVSAIVPAFNAAATIDETLRSIRVQTHREIEILVIDDGSRDATPEIAGRHAREDPRLRLICQPNAGVAAARNRGIAEARGTFVAPIDADDLWHADKIRRHVERLRAGSPRVALTYDWYAAIDMEGRILSTRRRPRAEGEVLREMCRGNLPGNGSSAVMRRDAVLEVGGYDATLRACGAQGCEDWKLHLQLAERHHFALIPDTLTGYRMVPGSMSGDVLQMLRSYDLVMQRVRADHPALAGDLAQGRIEQLRWLAARAVQGGQWRNVDHLIRAMLQQDRRLGLRALALLPPSLARRTARGLLRRRTAPCFPIG